MKLFTIGLIAGTAFAEPNLRPTDRKLSGGGTATVTWPDGPDSFDGDTHTLTIDDIDYDDLNTANGVKVLALAYYKQEYGKQTACMDVRNQFDDDVANYDSTGWSEYQAHLTAVDEYDSTDWDLYQAHLTAVANYDSTDWDLYQAHLTAVATYNTNYQCRQDYETNNPSSARLRAAKEAAKINARRRLEITSQHLLKALEYGNMLTSTMIDTQCGEEITNPGDWEDSDDYTGSTPSGPPGAWEDSDDYTGSTPSGPPGAWEDSDDYTGSIPNDPANEPDSDNYTWDYGDTTGNSIGACDPDENTDTCTLTHSIIICRLQVISNVIKALDPAMTDESIADTVA